LLYFKRALDERPNDSYASQAIRNVESYMDRNRTETQGTSSPQPTATVTPITQQQAVSLINQWLMAKSEIFAPPFNQVQLSNFATGELYASLANPNGLLDWLRNNRAYYRYGVQKVDSVERFAADRDRATIELRITEDRTLYQGGAVNPQHTDFSTKSVRYTLERIDGRWKIADYKTPEGLLLERSILNTTSSNRR
jgi:serine/threonine-protein kinase